MRFSSICFKRSSRSLSGQTSANNEVARGILRHPSSSLNASHQALRRVAMKARRGPGIREYLILIAAALAVSISCAAQQPEGPQSSAPAPVAPKPAAAPQEAGASERITVPSGTRVGVVLQNGISTRSAKPGDSIYLQTSFPITQNNRIVIPVGSYLRGELLESKRPGRVKGRGEFRLRLDTLILPNGYTVDLRAAPRSADSGGKETMDSEGKVTGGGNAGEKVGTVVTTTATGAGIGALATRTPKGAGIAAGTLSSCQRRGARLRQQCGRSVSPLADRGACFRLPSRP